MIVEAGKTFVEMVLTLVLYMGLFRVADSLQKQKILFTKDEQKHFKDLVTSTLVSMVSLLYVLYMHDAESLKRIHSWHLCLCIVSGSVDKKPLPQLCVFFMIVVTHMAVTYDSLHGLSYMAMGSLYHSVVVLIKQVPTLRKRNVYLRASLCCHVLFQILLMSYSCWVRTLQWTTFMYMMYLPYMMVYDWKGLKKHD